LISWLSYIFSNCQPSTVYRFLLERMLI
jgi:hypothetical protein